MQRFIDAQDNAQYERLIAEEHRIEFLMTVGGFAEIIVVNGEQVVKNLKNGSTTEIDIDGKIANPDDPSGPRITAESKGVFGSAAIRSLETHHRTFPGEEPSVGNAIAGEIDVVINHAEIDIPRAEKLMIYIRLTDAYGVEKTKWLQKGVFFIDTRSWSMDDDGLAILTIHGYDALRKANADYPSDYAYGSNVPEVNDQYIVQHIADGLGVGVDERTWRVMNSRRDSRTGEVLHYEYGIPIGYSMQEVLGFIAGSYGGNFVITDLGELRLISLADLPRETSYLIDDVGYIITFGMFSEDDPTEVVRIPV